MAGSNGNTVRTLAQIAATVLLALGLWILNNVSGQIDSLKAEISKLSGSINSIRVEVSEKYVSKEDFREYKQRNRQ